MELELTSSTPEAIDEFAITLSSIFGIRFAEARDMLPEIGKFYRHRASSDVSDVRLLVKIRVVFRDPMRADVVIFSLLNGEDLAHFYMLFSHGDEKISASFERFRVSFTQHGLKALNEKANGT